MIAWLPCALWPGVTLGLPRVPTHRQGLLIPEAARACAVQQIGPHVCDCVWTDRNLRAAQQGRPVARGYHRSDQSCSSRLHTWRARRAVPAEACRRRPNDCRRSAPGGRTTPKTVYLSILGLLAEGHILLKDSPGVGKTLLGKTIAGAIACDFKRIQLTPDLLPTDITGTTVFDMKSSTFKFIPGPIFANIVLADEINRTGPRTQSALLEGMAEHQVSIEGDVMKLPSPFMVIATQNLSESHGTFPLPDSQKDRFMISMDMGLPSNEQEIEILTRSQHGMPEATPVITAERNTARFRRDSRKSAALHRPLPGVPRTISTKRLPLRRICRILSTTHKPSHH